MYNYVCRLLSSFVVVFFFLFQLLIDCKLVSRLLVGAEKNEEARLVSVVIPNPSSCQSPPTFSSLPLPFSLSLSFSFLLHHPSLKHYRLSFSLYSLKPQGCRQGYMGHLVRIANSVARSGDSDDQVCNN